MKKYPVLNQAPVMKTYGGEELYLHAFLASALVGDEWSDSRPGRLIHGDSPLVPIGYEAGWAPEPVWTRWQKEKNPCPCRESDPGRSPRSLVTVLTECKCK
jgi:hypothetical protein